MNLPLFTIKQLASGAVIRTDVDLQAKPSIEAEAFRVRVFINVGLARRTEARQCYALRASNAQTGCSDKTIVSAPDVGASP
jgi:hypothetical protein